MKLPYWLVIFVFMLNVGLMFWALRERIDWLFIVCVSLCCALPHIPTRRDV